MLWKLDFKSIFVALFLIDCIFIMMQWVSLIAIEPPFILIIVLKFLIFGLCIWYYFKDGCHTQACYLSATIVLLLMLIGAIRGVFYVEGYWGYKGWMNCVHSAMSFVLLYPLGNPTLAGRSLQYWNKYIFLLFIFVGLWATNRDAYPFQIPFIYYFYILLFALVSSQPKARLIILFGTVCTLLAIENRSGVIKTMAAIGLCSTLYLPRYMVRFSHIFINFLLYILPVVLLILGLTGTFNVFESITEEKPTEITWHNNGEDEQNEVIPDLTVDTRTLLYAEVILSAIESDYVIFGNSIGRGNKTSFTWNTAESQEGERLMNEAHMLNVFTWTGILGVILYSIMYFQASWLGLFRSKNRYIPLIACAVAFHWAMLWLEECPSFKPMDFALFLLLGICFSPRFRNMSDLEFRLWFRSCFTAPEELTAYDALKKLKWRLLLKKIKIRNEKTKDSAHLL